MKPGPAMASPGRRQARVWQRARALVATALPRARAIASAALPRGAILLSALTFGGYAMGLVRDRLFARTFGAGAELDAYNAAFVLPELALDVLVAGGLVAPFVPLFVGLRAEAADVARDFGRTILTAAVLVMAVVAGTLFVFAPQTAAIIAPGFHGAQQELYVGLFRVMCVTPVIFAASIVLGEVLVAERRLLAYGLAPLLYNGGIVAGVVLLGEPLGIYGAAVGAVVGAVAHLGIRLIGIRQTLFRPWPRLHLRGRGMGEFARLMVPKMVSHPIEPLTFLYFTSVASRFDVGSVSSLSFARNFASVPVSLFGAAFAIAAFPLLSAAAAAGDRAAFRRTATTTLVTIVALAGGAAVGLFVLGRFIIGLFLGGGAFDDEAIDRTTLLLGLFALAIPLEAATHLLSRAIYATKDTLRPTAASLAGFAVTVVVVENVAPGAGLVAVPLGFAAGMAVKVAILCIALVPRVRRMGVVATPAAHDPWAVLAAPRQRRTRTVALSGALVILVVGVVYATGQAIGGLTFAVVPDVTPWARVNPPAQTSSSSASIGAPGSVGPSASSGAPGSAGPSASPSPTPRPGPFAMDLYEANDYVGEFTDTWCVAAAMQVSMNIMDQGADRTQATQKRLFNLSRSLEPAPDGAAEPEGWAQGLTELGYGNYDVAVVPTIRAAVQLAAKQLRATGRPVGFMVWRGAHSWVMSGFTASADPAVSDSFIVTAVRIEDVWYPRLSSIWGYSRPPDSLVKVADLDEDYLPWKRPRGTYPDKDGKYVLVIPVQ